MFSFEGGEGSDFQKNRLEIWVRANTQPSRRTIVHRAPPAGAAGPRRDEWGERLECAGWPARGRARRVKTRVQPRSGYNRASEQHAALPLQSACSIRGQTYPTPAAPRRVTAVTPEGPPAPRPPRATQTAFGRRRQSGDQSLDPTGAEFAGLKPQRDASSFLNFWDCAMLSGGKFNFI